MALSRRALFTPSKPRPPAAASPGSSRGDFWVHLSRPAMACRFEITLPSELSHRIDAARSALDGVDAIEAQLTVFRDTSALCQINRDAAAGPVPVDPRLFALLSDCRALSADTAGAFDVTAGPLSRVWGFLRRQGRIPTEAEIAAARAVVGIDQVLLENAESSHEPRVQTVRFAQAGVSLNLGAVGKGYALDVVAAQMARSGVETALLSAGASSFLALGRGPTGDGFRVGIRDPLDQGRRLGSLTLANAALAVSGAGEQFFEVDGRRYGHILDPRSGWPVEGRALTAVIAPTAARADALATAFFVGGADLAARYIERHPDVSALVIDAPTTSPADNRDGEGEAPRVTVLGRLPKWRMNRVA